jgi:hypothetical protein
MNVLVIQKDLNRLLHRRRPQIIAHALRVGIVVVRLGAVGAADGVVLVVHAVLRVAVLGLGVNVAVVGLARRGKSLLRGRLPAHCRHVRAAVGTYGTARLVVVRSCGGLENGGRTVCARVRGNRGTGAAHTRGV